MYLLSYILQAFHIAYEAVSVIAISYPLTGFILCIAVGYLSLPRTINFLTACTIFLKVDIIL